MRRSIKGITAGVLIFALCISPVFPVNAVTIDEAQQKADDLEGQKNAAEEEKQTLTEKLNKIISEMQELELDLEKKTEEIEIIEQGMVDAKAAEDNQYQAMKLRIRYTYENGETDALAILAASENIGDFLNKSEYVSMLSAYDREELKRYQKVVKEVQDKEKALKKEYEELKKLQDELVSRQTQVESLLSEQNLLLADLESQIGENAALLQDLIAQAEEEKRKQEEQAAAGGNGGNYQKPGGGNVVSGNGQFTNPCPGAYVSSTFGYRDFDSSFHKGLDLAAPTGTPTYAGDAGTVIIAGWSNSAGNWVVINHGNGFVTKYMHHSAICVTPGQYVERGQQIGYVGNTGNSFGAHLHYQVELNGTAVDPQEYM